MPRFDHSSGNDADESPLETDETILSMVFNNSKLSIEAMMPNNVNDVKVSVTPFQYIDVVIVYVKIQSNIHTFCQTLSREVCLVFFTLFLVSLYLLLFLYRFF